MAVVGAGPAGWAAAGALVAEGVSGVCLVAPEPDAPLRNGYGVWVDEVAPLGWSDVLSRTWPAVRVVTDRGARRIERPYGRVDNARLAERLRAAAVGVETVAAAVDEVGFDAGRAHLRLDAGETMEVHAVVDASGHESRLIRHAEGPEPGWQVAYGALLEVPGGHPFALDEALLMDFSPAEGGGLGSLRAPSFLYALPEGTDRVFVEETSLVARPPVAIDALEARLEQRLDRLGVGPRRVLEVERCYIPMGGPPAPPAQPVVGFGGAARMVHPASGYLLTRILAAAPVLARAIRSGLAEGATADEIGVRAWNAIWPPSLRSARELHRFGTEVLLELSEAETAGFFEAFFDLPVSTWSRYMAGDARPAEIRAAMLGVFARSGWTLRARLVRMGLGPRRGPLWSGLLGR